jgi:hypothetical protein
MIRNLGGNVERVVLKETDAGAGVDSNFRFSGAKPRSLAVAAL